MTGVQTCALPICLTLCVSTQVGCGFGCAFCLTGTMGLVRNLTAGEIVGQVWAARATLAPGARLTHVVFMGMGEPLANYAATVKALRILVAPLGFGFSPRRITVSTVGLVRGLERLARENLRVNLAISLHAPTDEVRSRLMPVNRGWGLDDLLAACRCCVFGGAFRTGFRRHGDCGRYAGAGVSGAVRNCRRARASALGGDCRI